MEEMIGNLLEQLTLGEMHSYKNMAVVPITLAEQQGLEYLTMRQGFEQEVLSVQEISEGGSVPELFVLNQGNGYVLLLDGEEIRGAKQNRVLNTSILVAPGSKTTIPVSCTEQGRWNYTSKEFMDSGIVMAHSIRSSKQAAVTRNVRHGGRFASDQGQVWAEVSMLHKDLGTASHTGALRDAYESRKADLESYIQAFSGLPVQNGIAVFLGDHLAGIDFLSHGPAMTDLLPKLIGSYAMDALRHQEMNRPPTPTGEAVQKFLKQAGRCTVEAHPSQGVGVDARLEGKTVQGAALVTLDTVIHLALFPAAKASASRGNMASLSRRRTLHNFRN